jgi:micrococcal nuclease
MEQTKYHYSCKVVDIHDGDTIKVDIDLGFGVVLKSQTFRFFGINAPEIHGETKTAGLKTTAYVQQVLADKDIIIESIKDEKEKFGRWLGKIYYLDGSDWKDLNQELLDKDLAVKFMDGGQEI